MSKEFDYKKALEAIQSGQAITGKDGVLAPLLQQLTEAALTAELEAHLSEETEPNRKNGKISKTLKTSAGNIRLETPSDRSGTFDPQFIKKNESSVNAGIESKILAMYGRSLSYSDHQIRNTIRCIGWKNQRKLMKDLKPVYRAISKQADDGALDALEEKKGATSIRQSSSRGVESGMTCQPTSNTLRTSADVIYTINAVEAVHRQFRKLTKTKGAFPNENNLLKLLYLGIENASKKWTMTFRDWGQTLSQLAIFFEGRLDDVIEL